MKTRTCISFVAVAAAFLWACWSFAYQRGYAMGARDEFARWKQVPMALDESWDGTIAGRRQAWALPGGKELPVSGVAHLRIGSVDNNRVPSTVLPSHGLTKTDAVNPAMRTGFTETWFTPRNSANKSSPGY